MLNTQKFNTFVRACLTTRTFKPRKSNLRGVCFCAVAQRTTSIRH